MCCAQQQAKVVGATVVEKTDEDFLSRCVASFSRSTVMITESGKKNKTMNCLLQTRRVSTSEFCLQ
jgi:hypothetical protein